MPGTACLACSVRMKEFQAASMGRGSDVLRMVSSMSLTMPKSTSSPITWMLASAEAPPSPSNVTACQPGARPGLRTRTSM